MDNALKERLELAALVMPDVALVNNASTGEEYFAVLDSSPHHHCISGDGRWNPHTDDADSRRLEIACLNWIEGNIVTYPESVDDAQKLLEKARRSGDAEQYRAAVLDLAVAIGSVIKEQDHD